MSNYPQFTSQGQGSRGFNVQPNQYPTYKTTNNVPISTGNLQFGPTGVQTTGSSNVGLYAQNQPGYQPYAIRAGPTAFDRAAGKVSGASTTWASGSYQEALPANTQFKVNGRSFKLPMANTAVNGSPVNTVSQSQQKIFDLMKQNNFQEELNKHSSIGAVSRNSLGTFRNEQELDQFMNQFAPNQAQNTGVPNRNLVDLDEFDEFNGSFWGANTGKPVNTVNPDAFVKEYPQVAKKPNLGISVPAIQQVGGVNENLGALNPFLATANPANPTNPTNSTNAFNPFGNSRRSRQSDEQFYAGRRQSFGVDQGYGNSMRTGGTYGQRRQSFGMDNQRQVSYDQPYDDMSRQTNYRDYSAMLGQTGTGSAFGQQPQSYDTMRGRRQSFSSR